MPITLDACTYGGKTVIHLPSCTHADERSSGGWERNPDGRWETGLSLEQARARIRAGEARACLICGPDWNLRPEPTVAVCGICWLIGCDCAGEP